MNIDFMTASGIILGSSVVATLVSQAFQIVHDKLTAKKDGGFSALYVAIELEAYASKCAYLISDINNYTDSNGAAGELHQNINKFQEYSQKVDWKSLGLQNTTQAMSFKIEVENTCAWVSDAWEFMDDDVVLSLILSESARLGLKALNLAEKLRKVGDIEPVNYSNVWNVKAFLERSLNEE